jgi:putative cardiolipin synthase
VRFRLPVSRTAKSLESDRYTGLAKAAAGASAASLEWQSQALQQGSGIAWDNRKGRIIISGRSLLQHYRPLLVLCLAVEVGCSSLPGRDVPRPEPASAHTAPNAALSEPFASEALLHKGASGFRLFSLGIDGLLLRLELIGRAQNSLYLQYYIFRGDESGRLITEALMQAAERGVRIRILVDDAETAVGDEQLFALAAMANVSIRIFNPWHYRGHSRFLRGTEFVFNKSRLDYRMHNKLFIVDGTAALIGGRNIGDQYFQVDPESQYADDDVFVTGPMVAMLAGAFQTYWESRLAISLEALAPAQQYSAPRASELAARHTVAQKATTADAHYAEKLAAGEPLASLLSGATPVSWATAELACDNPDKQSEGADQHAGSLTFGLVAAALRETRSELLMVTPYLIPSPEELKLLTDRPPQRRVRILTTSLEANNDPLAESGYDQHRVALLQSGVELYELRARPETARGTGQSAKMAEHGTYSLHAKLLIFDRSAIFVGSMNYDARSRWFNTEIGVVIHSPQLATQGAQRFEAMTQPTSAYTVTLAPSEPDHAPKLLWHTVSQGKPITYDTEPSRNAWQRMQVRTLSLFSLDHEL